MFYQNLLGKKHLKSKTQSNAFSITTILRTKFEISADAVGVTKLLYMYGSICSPSAQQMFLPASTLGAVGLEHIQTSVAVESECRSSISPVAPQEQTESFWLVVD